MKPLPYNCMSSKRAWVTVPKGPGSGSRKGLGHVVTGSLGLGMSSKRAWVTVPKGPGSGSRKGLSHGKYLVQFLLNHATSPKHHLNAEAHIRCGKKSKLCGTAPDYKGKMCGKVR